MADLGSIVAFGAYAPRLRLSRATIGTAMEWLHPPNKARAAGSRSACNWDEDALTLAVEAAASARSMAAGDERVDALTLASTTLPFDDRDSAAIVAAALDLPEKVETLNVTSSMRAGTSALANAVRRPDIRTLVVASDCRLARPGSPQELSHGHGAAAMLVQPPDGGASLAAILAVEQIAADFVDHYRGSGQSFDYGLEERWVRDAGYSKLVGAAIEAAVGRAKLKAGDIAHVAMPGAPDVIKRILHGSQLTLAKAGETLRATCGDSGTAQPLLLLAGALERAKPGEHILLIGFGQGVDVLVLRAEAALAQIKAKPLEKTLARGVEETSYVRYLSNARLLDVDFGMRAERDSRTAHTVAWRKHRALNAFVGGRCERCSTVQFPASRVCVNPECRATDTQKDHVLSATTGRVKSFTEDWQAYTPRPPAIYGNIEFVEGGNLLMELTDLDQGQLSVGDTVRFAFRIKDFDRPRAFRRYFWKAVKE